MRHLTSILGDRSRFAIEYALDPDRGGVWPSGKICYRAKGRRVGDFELGASLRDALFAIEHLLRDRGRREDPGLFRLSALQLAYVLDDALYRGDDRDDESRALSEAWARHDVSLPLDVLGGWKLFLVERGADARLIALDATGAVGEVSLRAGEVDRVLDEARAALAALCQAESSAPAGGSTDSVSTAPAPAPHPAPARTA